MTRIMATQDLDQRIRTRIDSFLLELAGLVKKAALESVHQALGQGSAPRLGAGRTRTVAMRRGTAPRKISTRSVRGKRTSEQVDQAATRVLAQIRSKPGQRLEEIGAALRTPTKILKLPVSKLLAAKKLKTKGRKRGTKYFVR